MIRLFKRYRARVGALAKDNRAVAMVELAICLPFFMTTILWIIELANYAMVRQRVSQLALMVADNAARMGDQSVLGLKPISEGEINDLFVGAGLQSGALNLGQNGRIILSSLQTNLTGGQWINWQRCNGLLPHTSSYGSQGAGLLGNSFAGMGPASGRVTALPGTPVMYVEIAYRYQPIVSTRWAPSSRIVEVASMMVRDDREQLLILPTVGQLPSICI